MWTHFRVTITFILIYIKQSIEKYSERKQLDYVTDDVFLLPATIREKGSSPPNYMHKMKTSLVIDTPITLKNTNIFSYVVIVFFIRHCTVNIGVEFMHK